MNGKLIRLRAIETEDTELIYKWENDPSIWIYGNTPWPQSSYNIEEYILRESSMDMWQDRQTRLMIDTIDGVTVGCVDLCNFDPLNCNCTVGIIVAAPYRRCGYAREALSLVEELAFSTFLVHTIEAGIQADNEASLALFRSAGYVEIGRRKEWLRHGDKYYDEILMSKTHSPKKI